MQLLKPLAQFEKKLRATGRLSLQIPGDEDDDNVGTYEERQMEFIKPSDTAIAAADDDLELKVIRQATEESKTGDVGGESSLKHARNLQKLYITAEKEKEESGKKSSKLLLKEDKHSGDREPSGSSIDLNLSADELIKQVETKLNRDRSKVSLSK